MIGEGTLLNDVRPNKKVSMLGKLDSVLHGHTLIRTSISKAEDQI